jgi:hypothetical protein
VTSASSTSDIPLGEVFVLPHIMSVSNPAQEAIIVLENGVLCVVGE